jgi:hypothetical protein
VSTELLHFSLYAVLSYPQLAVATTPVSTVSTQTSGTYVLPQSTPTWQPLVISSQTSTPVPTIVAAAGGGAPVGAIAGGAVGSIFLIGMAAFAYQRYVRHQTSARVEPIHPIEGSGADDAAHPLLGEGMFPPLSCAFYLF